MLQSLLGNMVTGTGFEFVPCSLQTRRDVNIKDYQ